MSQLKGVAALGKRFEVTKLTENQTESAREFYLSLLDRKIELYADGPDLRYHAPQGALTAELRARMAALKPDLLTLCPPEPHWPERGVSEIIAALRAAGAEVALIDGKLRIGHHQKVPESLKAEAKRRVRGITLYLEDEVKHGGGKDAG